MAVTAFAGERPGMLVGDSFKVVTGYATAIIQCQCEAKSVVVLHGKDKVSTCPNCRKGFAIAKAGKMEVGEVVMPVDGALEH